MEDERIATIAKALGHPARLRIVRLLACQPECSGSEVFGGLPLAQSTISQHLAVLKDAGIVDSHPVGSGHVYCLDAEALEIFGGEVVSMAAMTPTCTPDTKERR